MKGLFSLYYWRYPSALVYMLQNTEYQTGPYLKWFWRTNDFSRVMYRRHLQPTKAAWLLLAAVWAGIVVQVLIGAGVIFIFWSDGWPSAVGLGAALIIAYPVVWAHLVVVPLELGRVLINRPLQWRNVRASRRPFANFQGFKIAVAGSYGKTSMKEILLTVLGEGKKVAATTANKNVAVSHAQFVSSLKGNEEILIIEYGEGGPGDVVRFTDVTRPTHAVITGLAPAHLDHYKTLAAAGRDIFSVADSVPHAQVYVNGESSEVKAFVQSGMQLYDRNQALGWRINSVRVNLDGTRFTMQRPASPGAGQQGKTKLELHSGLLGRHQVGPLAMAVALAHELGLTKQQIEAGVAKTMPFDHRMQSYQLGGAWVVDDSYNGNLEGIRAGTELLKDLPGKRKIYVTPGLVDQGKDSPKIHEEMGRLIAGAKPDMVVLMQHSVTADIQRGLEAGGYKGELLIETDPLNFYNNLQLFVANGDLVMLQNDWPDNYN